MNYVIFRTDENTNQELYIDARENLKSTLHSITSFKSDARRFGTARQAYEWGGRNGCDWWRVGKRD